ncbi:selenium metabolism-associated LysR family transcriptional regulator [Mesobacillus subterraneus]|uniref:selenium metabolism-associated LysR family transcriptional regulator n=1 Tax=Mesobacillus subterraneus TaxID=285983 RepID=UPI0020415E72|nr:selenium metabolism-associated LysR family transcriptional regulator [Mesobacillus subterraneus]MCM3663401.1 selenium metabolism-associated LysR family transcriptional regulator [Mesobacillus subterraneus]MCM3683172.1 selenium metabolism-associated LysR family transcriptional regulator [Mesobacillus subterraneus]
MNLKKLEAFIMVVEKNSFSEAAAALKSSQPTVSLKIKSLEEDLGFELLDRGVSGIRPTPAGMLVYTAAKDIANRWRILEDELGEFQGTLTGTLTIGASTIPGTYLLPGWVKKFRSLYPKVEVRIEIGDSKKVLNKLQNHQVDVGIIGMEIESKQIKCKPIASDSLVLIAPNGHPLLHAPRPDFAQVQQFEFVLREEGSGTRKMMEDYLTEKGFSVEDLKTAVSIGSTESVIAAVEAGLGISFISKLAALPAAKAGRVQIIDSFEPYQRDFYLAVLADAENRSIIKQFAGIMTS